MATLLRVETDFLSVELQGRVGPPTALAASGRVPRPARLRVEATSGSYLAEVAGGAQFDPATNAPCLYEESSYWMVVESRIKGFDPVVLQRDPTLISQRHDVPGHGIATLSIVYRRQVGLSQWRFRVAEHELVIEFEVFPAKLDYDLDYEALVSDITNVKRALAIEYFRGTHHLGGVDRAKSGEPLEWMTLLRRSMSQLARALHQVNRAPHQALQYERRLTPMHRIRGATPSVIQAVARREGVGELIEVPGVGRMHAALPVARSVDTLDTFEHRWLRSRLRYVHSRLLSLLLDQDHRIHAAASRGGGEPTRLTAERSEIEELIRSAQSMIDLPVLGEASSDVPASYSSLQLQTATGYGEAYRALTALSSALSVIDGEEEYSLADVHELYEVWCFLKVVQVVADATNAVIDLSAVLKTSSSGLRFNLIRGAGSRVVLDSKPLVVTISYNEEFRMPTGTQKPDIVLRLRHADRREIMVVLDAKYRLDASAEYVRQFGSPGAPLDAVNALHRYRDAIRPSVNGRRETAVVSGVALFPWPMHLESEAYGLRRSLDEIGVGAIPFLPGNEDGVSNWLSRLLSDDLSRPPHGS